MPGNTPVFYADYARRHALPVLCALSGLLGSCTTYDGDEVAAAAYGYPLDVDYATYASAYDGAYTDARGYPVPLPATYTFDAGSAQASDPVSAIRAVALDSEPVCPGQVTREPQTAPPHHAGIAHECALRVNRAMLVSHDGITLSLRHQMRSRKRRRRTQTVMQAIQTTQ